jgi:uncharacterized protein (TIGR00661 family)
MRIAYGVHGYGRGHATRALAVLDALAARHELQLFAGGDAHDLLRTRFPVSRVPCLGLAYRHGRRDTWLTLRNNLQHLTDLLRGGAGVTAVASEMRDFAPDVVICDAEPWTNAAAQKLGVPRISFDHFGVLVHCEVALPLADWFESLLDRLAYRWLMRWPERVLVSSFFRAEPRRPSVKLVGPLQGALVRRFQPSVGQHLLVYFNQGPSQLTPRMLEELASIGSEVRLYGLGCAGQRGAIRFRAPMREGFLEDLASCRAVLSTAGNQLMGEAMAYAKPVLVVPEATVEQRLNAREIVRMGIGESLQPAQLDRGAILAFLARADAYAARARELGSDGQAQAVEWLERWVHELSKSKAAPRLGAVQPV